MSDTNQKIQCLEKIYAALPGLLLPWYRENARTLPWRVDRAPYHVWLSEIMLQQTRVETVKGYYRRFLAALPDIKALADAPGERLLKLWEGLGYYSRARNLQKAAREIMERHGGVFPRDFNAILALPGIGPYTAGAIASICFDAPVPALDGNVLRVIARLTNEPDCVDTPAVKKRISAALSGVYPAGACGDFTQSLMELGATVCPPNGAPNCTACPLSALCLGKARGTAARLPVRSGKRARRIEPRTVFSLRCGDRIALRKRADTGLLAGFWELPNVQGTLTETEAARRAGQWGVAPLALLRSVEKTHIFTHVEWHMTCYYLTCRVEAPCFRWADAALLDASLPLPTAFRIFL